jgi:hypothetical protein
MDNRTRQARQLATWRSRHTIQQSPINEQLTG